MKTTKKSHLGGFWSYLSNSISGDHHYIIQYLELSQFFLLQAYLLRGLDEVLVETYYFQLLWLLFEMCTHIQLIYTLLVLWVLARKKKVYQYKENTNYNCNY